MGIPMSIRAGKGCTCGGISMKFAHGVPRTHNEIVPIWGATYTPFSMGNFYTTQNIYYLDDRSIIDTIIGNSTYIREIYVGP
jgi:hypothetical protein